MLNWLKNLPWFVQIGLAVVVLGLCVFIYEKGGTLYAHYKWGKSDKEVAATLQKSDELEKQSATLKAQADQNEKLAEVKQQQIDELTQQVQKYGSQAAASVQAINDSYKGLENDKQVIQNSTDDELRYRICKDRADLGFPNVGQCKGWKEQK